MIPSSLELPSDFNLTVDPMDAFDPDEVYGGPDVSERLKEHEVSASTIIETLPSWWTEFAIQIYDKEQHQMVSFPFTNRRYLKQIYDSPSDSFILLFGRQSEKCLPISSKISNAYGELVSTSDLSIGSFVLSMGDDFRLRKKRVVKKYVNGRQNFIRITTRLGHKLEVTRSHPIRTLYGMTPAGELKVKDRIASITRGGEFGEHEERETIIKLVAYLIGDGCIGRTSNFSYTQLPGPALDDFIVCAKEERVFRDVYDIKNTRAFAVHLSQKKDSYLVQRLQADGLWGHRSHDKFIPSWVYELSRDATALFLNRLWSTDGYVSRRSASQYEISYCSVSERLIDGVQALLWKFGIPTRRVEYKPKGGRLSWKLYVQTQQGIRTFLEDIGALGKSEGVPIPEAPTNNNRYTIPKEINQYLKANVRVYRRGGVPTLAVGGLDRAKLKYAPSPEKLAKYAAYIDRAGGDAQFLWDIIEGDVLWDTIVAIEDIGEDDAYDIEVEDTHNYVANGIVTHNSTTLGNLAITHCCLMPYVHILYVAPSNAQTRMFSKDRIKEPIEASPRVRAFTSAALTQNVFEKTFTNRSTVILKYAFYTADRIRGIAADVVLIDEIQDVLTDNIPVIEETMAASPIKKRYYSGTPKTLESTLGIYWALSSQNEWVIPCDCQLPNRYWNILDGRNVGNKGLICNNCGKPINPYHADACWASAAKFDHYGNKRKFQGYRVPQIMVPIHQGDGWPEILRKKDEYPPDKFDNEVLGMFSDAGDRPITRDELMACCSERLDPYDESMLENIRRMSQGGATPIYAGLDWGYGDLSQSRSGYTVLTLGSYLGTQDFKIFYIRRFDGEESDPNRQLPIIGKILNTFNVKIVGADFGAGFVSNAQIQEMIAHRGAILLRFQYSSNPKKKARYNEDAGSYILHRSQMMGNLFNMLKRAKRTGKKVIHLPRWEFFERPYGSDILSIYSEYNEGLRMIKYDHPLDRPDDSFHSILYCLLASTVEFPRKDIFGFVDIRTGF